MEEILPAIMEEDVTVTMVENVTEKKKWWKKLKTK